MTIWTPAPSIRVKVLGLVWRGDELLLAEVEDSRGRVKGLRPLGGSIEFGETREQALRREFMEELGCTATLAGPWHGLENIYEHEGAVGHEYLFLANVEVDAGIYRQERISFEEANGVECFAVWCSPTATPYNVDLYPSTLLPLIQAGVVHSGG